MDKVFLLKDVRENVVGKFRISINKAEGLEYHYMNGIEPCWQDIVAITSLVISRNRIPSEGEYFFNEKYAVVPDNTFDVRYVPILKNGSGSESVKLPVTVDGDRILEHSFKVSFEPMIKVLLALTMSYGPKTLVLDKKKQLSFARNCRREYAYFVVAS